MKIEGIHNITAITGEAQANIDFYAGLLGLRMVKKTVNQDQPSVYHLFYADEEGDPGADITFFEFPGAPRGRAGAGMVHRIAWRVGSPEALDFWAERLAAAGVDSEREGEALRFADPEGLEHELVVATVDDPPLIADHPEVPAELALQGFHGARAYSAAPSAARACSSGSSSSARTPAGRRAATPAAGSGPTTSRRPSAGSRAPALFTTSPGPRRWTSISTGASADRRRRAPDPGDRPLLVSLDLLPRAERGAVRGRDPGTGFGVDEDPEHLGEADPAAVPRVAAGTDRGRAHPGHQPARRASRMSGELVHRLREPAGEPAGALVLNHGRGADENDLYGLLDELDPERRLLGVSTGAPLTNVPPGGRHWYLVPRVGHPDPVTFAGSYAALTSFLDGLLAERGIDWARTVIGGFSMGAVMSYAVGLGPGRPSPAAILAFSGFIPTVEGWQPRSTSAPACRC